MRTYSHALLTWAALEATTRHAGRAPATWAVLGNPAIGAVAALAGDPGRENGTLYAATSRGLWRLTL